MRISGLLGAVVAFGLSTAANAYTLITLPVTPEIQIHIFDGIAHNTGVEAGSFAADGISFVGSGSLIRDVPSSDYGVFQNFTEMAILGGGSETLTWATPQTAFSLLWLTAGLEDTLSIGSTIISGLTLALAGIPVGGNYEAPNLWVSLTGLDPFTTISFSTPVNAFEFIPDPPAIAAVPEATTWAMMLLGFAGLGFLGWRGSRKTAASAA
jgi:PEP-CTERM motif